MKYSLLISFILLAFLSSQSYALEKVSLQLQWKHQFEYAGFYAAIEKDFYRAEGLDVELYEAQTNKDPVQEVLSAKKTYGISYSSLIGMSLRILSFRFNDLPIRMKFHN